MKHMSKNTPDNVKSFPELENMNPTVLNRLIDNVITLYQAREISYVDIIYTEYVNTLNFGLAEYRERESNNPKTNK